MFSEIVFYENHQPCDPSQNRCTVPLAQTLSVDSVWLGMNATACSASRQICTTASGPMRACQLKQVMRYQIRELQCRTSATTEVRPRTYQTGCCSSPKPHLFEVVWKSLQNTFRAVLGPWLRQLLQHARNSSGVSSWFEVWREHYNVPISALTISVWCWLCLVATGQFQRVRPFPVSLNVQA